MWASASVLVFLLLGLAAGARVREGGLSMSEMSAKQQLAARAGARLMAGAQSFLATQVSSREKDHERRKATVHALEQAGMPLEDQFQLFLFSRAAYHGLVEVDEKQTYFKGTDPDAADEDEVESTSCPVEQTQADLESGNGCTEMPAYIESQLVKFDRQVKNASMSQQVTEVYLSKANVNKADAIDAEVETDVGNWMGLDEVLRGNQADFSSPLSQVDEAAYRAWKKKQGLKVGAWYDTTMKKLQSGLYPPKPKELKALYVGLQELSAELADMNDKVSRAADVSWKTVEKRIGFLSRLYRGVKTWVSSTISNIYQAIKAIWNAFKARNADDEAACSTEMRTRTQSAADRYKIMSQDQIKESVPDAADAASSNDLMMEQVGKSMAAVTRVQKEKPANVDVLKNQSKLLNDTYQSMRRDVEEGMIDYEKVESAQERLEVVKKEACQVKQNENAGRVWTVLSSLKSSLQRIKEMGKNALHMSVPTIGFRGLGANAGLFGGGLEEVIDFRNREIGYFTWGALQAGTSALSTGVGGYLGMAYHGYKANWSLQDSYITAVYTAYSPGINYFGLQASVGVTFALDADNSAGTFRPWVPEPQGINGVALGWSLGTGISLPIEWGVDVGQALYHMHTSECFDSGLHFLGGILNKLCLGCEGKEAVLISALRTGTWLAGFPVVSDIIFFVLWGINELIREPEWQQHCSEKSTNLRNNPQHMGRTIAQQIEEIHQSILQVERGTTELERMLAEALLPREGSGEDMAAIEERIENSEEIDLVSRVREEACLNRPPNLDLPDGREWLPFGLRTKEEIKAAVDDMNTMTLLKWCTHYKLANCEDYVDSDIEYVRKELRLKASEASSIQEFGKCDSDDECTVNLKNSFCDKSSGVKAWMGFRRGDCRCQEGYCYAHAADACVAPEHLMVNESIHEGMNVWLTRRKIQLGAFVDQLKLLAEGK